MNTLRLLEITDEKLAKVREGFYSAIEPLTKDMFKKEIEYYLDMHDRLVDYIFNEADDTQFDKFTNENDRNSL